MPDNTYWKKWVKNSKYIGEWDFQPGEEKLLTIKSVNYAETIVTADGKDEKVVVYFEEPEKPLILNNENAEAIEKATGSKYMKDWPGHMIQLYVKPDVRAFGKIVPAVRVRPRKVTRQAVKCADCGGDIQPAAGKGADYIVQGTQKTYGVALCWACACKHKEGAVTDGTAETDG